ncbi:MAG: histidine triad nucleotide-binding protein [Candidatus Omnitrophota bacterium]|nr:histidine triad nucleotide-binding protein [Candidatus Omnitrophota bacterium]
MNKDCLFCKVIDGTIKSEIVYRDEQVVAFKDINPQAPVHILVIPRRHIEKISDLSEENKLIVSNLVLTANRLARSNKIDQGGYRLVLNCGPDAGQAVFHIHLHLLGGRKLNWPPG